MHRSHIVAGVVLVALIGVVAWALIHRPAAPPEGRRPPLEIPPKSAPAAAKSRSPEPPASEGADWSPLVRVNLTPEPAKTVTVSVDGPWEVHPVGSNRVLARGAKLSECEATATAAGLRIGTTQCPVARVELAATNSPSIWINGHQYRGSVRFFRRTDGALTAVNVVSLEDYVAAVVDGEMPASFGDEARKSQAIVARTYALWRISEAAGHPEFDLYNSSRSQKYLGFQYRATDERRLAGESDSSRRAARETSGVVCTHDGRLFCTYYCAVCGGKTTEGTRVFADAAPPHQSVACEWCREAGLYRWTTKLSHVESARLLKSYYAARKEPFGTLASLEKSDPTDDNPAATFEASDGQRTRKISAAELRRLVPVSTLYSTNFAVRSDGSHYVFEGRGHGHGVGLCQWGARGMAASGRDCYDILRHYYRGTEFVTVTAPRSGNADRRGEVRDK